MIKSFVFCIISLLLYGAAISYGAAEQDVLSLFEAANRSATSKEWNKAITLYKKIAGSHGISAPLFFNLANCYAATGEVGRAVLNYERALRLAPGNSDIQENLAQIRKDAGLYRDATPLYERFSTLLGADQWLLLAGTGFCILSLSLLGASCRVIPPALTRWIAAGSLLLILCTLLPALLQYSQWDEGIVIGNNATLLISPFDKADATGKIQAGRRVEIKKHHGNFVLIKDSTGKSGWLANKNLGIITTLQDLQ
jgi:tetratricopeptide (TPR) repeat protein